MALFKGADDDIEDCSIGPLESSILRENNFRAEPFVGRFAISKSVSGDDIMDNFPASSLCVALLILSVNQ